MLYDNIRDMRAKVQPGQDMELTAAFDEHLTKVMNELKEVLEQDTSRFHRNAHFSRAKHLLYEICSCKAIEHFKILGERTPADIFSSLRRAYNEIIDGLIQTILVGSQSRPASQQAMHSPLVVAGGAGADNQDIVSMKTNLAKAEKETAAVLEAAEQLEQKVASLTLEKEQMAESFAAEKMELAEENKSLQEENKKLLETLIRHSKGTGAGGAVGADSVLAGEAAPVEASPAQVNSGSYHSRKLIKGLGLSGQVGPT